MALKHEQENGQMSTLTETLRSNLNNPVSSPEFDLYTSLDKVLSGVGLSAADSGGKITFYGKDPIVPSLSQIRRDVGDRFGRRSCSSICHLEI